MTWKRAATATVLIPLAVGLVLWGSTGILALGVALVTMLALFEYFALGDAIGHRGYRFWTATCALILVYVQWRAVTGSVYRFSWNLTVYRNTEWFAGKLLSIESVFFLFVLGIAAITIFTKRPIVEALPAAGMSSSGLILIAYPFSFAIQIHGSGTEGPRLLLLAMVIIWVGDSAAYFVGRSIGKHALAPRLSPKKTWEGTLASFLGSLAVGAIFARFINVPLPHLLGMAAVGNLAGQVGDLLESAYKRSAGIKDSGSLLPGHGGVLDRIDALILAIPVVWYYWILVYSRNS